MSKLNLNNFGQYFINEDFETIYKATSKEFQQMLGLNEFQHVCHAFNQGVQHYEKFLEKQWFGTTQVVWLDQNKEKAIQFVYDQNQVITGLYVKPFETHSSDHKMTKNHYRMPICNEWFVFWGGINEFENYHYVYENQRYAYDLVRVKNGATFEGTNLMNENYYAFGTDVVAPLHGKIVKVVDGLKDNIPGETDEQHPAGNYVIIEHPHEEYSMIAHLKKGSIVVKEDELVKEGQLLGKCGNSGNSSEAHIHFQVMDRPQFEKAKSIRIQFQDDREPVQGDTVVPLPLDEKNMDTFDKVENSLTFADIVLTIPRIIGQYFKG